ncbi:Nif3-like dinuclear metal center hexameric protein [PVC group bacterium (ex Bugula neritina AB1)]|nr:Nif3-like dinuclear metal center hexameric protein [PVC group bacterium (ex Bugula neritina AB1)]
MKLEELVTFLDKELDLHSFKRADISLNGLQVGDLDQDIQKVACSVDASLEVFQKSVEIGAQMLFVHHGLFWGKCIALRGIHYERFRCLINNSLALYAAHLPLDAHPLWGNNKGLADKLGLESMKPFGQYNDKMIGFSGKFSEPLEMKTIIQKLALEEKNITIWDFHSRPISSVAIISGDAPREVLQAIDEEMDLYITGESSHALYHECKEAGMNVIFAGHYETETYGPRLVGEMLSEKFDLDVTFLDVPTGL